MKILCLFGLSVFLIGSIMPTSASNSVPEVEQAVNSFISSTAKDLTNKYNMRLTGTNTAMPRGIILLLGLDFQIVGPIPKEKIRKILISATQDFLFAINSDKNLKRHLQKNPFTIENIEITLFFKDNDGRGLRDPNIGIASVKHGRLEYDVLVSVFDKELNMDIPKFKAQEEESYEEALKLMKQSDGDGIR